MCHCIFGFLCHPLRWTPCFSGWPHPLMRAAQLVSFCRFSTVRTIVVSCSFHPTWASCSPLLPTLPHLHREFQHPHSWVTFFPSPKSANNTCGIFSSSSFKVFEWRKMLNPIFCAVSLPAGLQRSQEKSSICPSLQDFSFTSWNPEQVRQISHNHLLPTTP